MEGAGGWAASALSSTSPFTRKGWVSGTRGRVPRWEIAAKPPSATSANATKQVPPSGAVAGLYGRVDTEVGVWEAPANRALVGVQNTIVPVSDGQWDLLNPIGINVIRAFPGEGVKVMGLPWGSLFTAQPSPHLKEYPIPKAGSSEDIL